MPRHTKHVKVTVVIMPGPEDENPIGLAGLKANAHAVVDEAMDRIEEVYADSHIAVMSELVGGR